ncbi:Pr6Pr family membrane protein [Chitinophaga niabensis]|uniref:FAR-17a/AIG1-like protein n=1 Tax=Chitinophaga niabensis TaxID=536979 RepID=A0A1N6GJR2_9BACT|nr:Pr6Pr family membrane protein [Chitinophaga niabensis]SIO07756.1 hypothetical protein SAMN04488055_2814 [Chitinophaga niabensis]
MKIYLFIIALLGWFALIAQFYILINSEAAPLPELVIRFFSFFTILTNLLVAVCSSVLLARPVKPATVTALTVYILIVGLVYNVVLRFLWQPQGLQWVVDELLHTIVPVLFFIYWFMFVAKNKLAWNSFWPWLIFPLVYILYTFIRGSFSGFYPYPFLDVPAIGFNAALINAVGVAVLFIAISLLLIGISRKRGV